MKKIFLAIFMISIFGGCTGIFTGHQYTLSDVQRAKEAYIKARDGYTTIKKEAERLEKEGFAVATDLKTTKSSSSVSGK